jgi:hypothetical protein
MLVWLPRWARDLTGTAAGKTKKNVDGIGSKRYKRDPFAGKAFAGRGDGLSGEGGWREAILRSLKTE